MNHHINNFPADAGFRMPAEWETHAGTLLIWPDNRETWPGKRLKAVERVYREIIHILLMYEPIVLLTANSETAKRATSILGNLSSFNFSLHMHTVPVNDIWARDSGPIFIRQKKTGAFALTDWEFNSWGGKYEPWEDDNRIPNVFADLFGVKRFEASAVLEGGSIETNGEGLFITTESVLLNPNRNPGLSKKEVEGLLRNYLGTAKTIWLKRGLVGDDTDGHIDDLTRFVNKDTVITAVTDNPGDPNFEILMENWEILQMSTDQHGNPLHIIPVQLPETRVEDPTVDGSEYVPASYVNFYVANGVVLLPLYDRETDDEIIDLFSALFPGRTIEGISCNDLVWGQGSIHCITQQLYGIDI